VNWEEEEVIFSIIEKKKDLLFTFWEEEVIFLKDNWEAIFPENKLHSVLEKTGSKLILNRLTSFGVKWTRLGFL